MRSHAFGTIDGTGGEEHADANAANAFADHVVEEIPRRAQHSRCSNDDEDAATLDGASTTEVPTGETGEGAPNGDEDGRDTDEGLLCCRDMALFHQEAGRLVGPHVARAESLVVGGHQENDTAIARVEVADPSAQAHPQGEVEHEPRGLLLLGGGSWVDDVAARRVLNVLNGGHLRVGHRSRDFSFRTEQRRSSVWWGESALTASMLYVEMHTTRFYAALVLRCTVVMLMVVKGSKTSLTSYSYRQLAMALSIG